NHSLSFSSINFLKSSMDSSVAPHIVTENGRENGDEEHAKVKEKPSRGGWSAAIFIIFVEMAERFSYYGLAGNLVTYLSNVLGESTVTASKNVNTWVGVSALFPLIGGFLADSYFGRFKTVIASSMIYLLGMILLSLAVSTVVHSKIVFYIALYILSVGEGGHKPCVQTFAADQFDENTPEEKEAKSSFFNWWYLGIVFGATTSILVIVYIQENVGWAVGFGILAGILAAALGMFLVGIKRYRKEVPVGSPFTKVVQVFIAAVRKWRVRETRGICNEDDDGMNGKNQLGQSRRLTLARTKQLRFLDKAMILDEIDCLSAQRNPWRLCTQNQVEQVKLVIRVIPIWLACLMFFAVQAQNRTFFTKQGSTMIKSIGPHFELPPAALQSVIGLAILIFVPIYDQVFVRLARKKTGLPSGITMLQRIGIGLFLSIIFMIVAALVEAKRIKTAREHGLMDTLNATLPITIAWLLPQYVLSGLCDVFTVVGLQELFYDQMPEEMRSMGAAAYISIIGVGSFLNSIIISIVEVTNKRAGGTWLSNNINRAHLDYFYWVLAGLSALNLCIFIWIAKRFVYKKVVKEESREEEESMNGERNNSHDHV
ncbi:protein NRT1/ PTR FAMILY 5.4-like, partial [Pistacia vera]|uniref:protein NRT1/ PTR FAMILY 5.4-like n=1 Tax=Pistacia vera TaxID=55513 RepID=UPI001263C0F6